jgi:hypothetical protein
MCKGQRINHSIVLGADPSPLAALPLGTHTTSMRPPRALPSGRLDTDHRPSDPFEGPNVIMVRGDPVLDFRADLCNPGEVDSRLHGLPER